MSKDWLPEMKWNGGVLYKMYTPEKLRDLRRIWVAGAFPTTGNNQCRAALVIDELIRQTFVLRRHLQNLTKEA